MLQEIFRKIGDWNRDVRSVLALAFQTSSINFTLSFRKTRSLCEPRMIQRTRRTTQNQRRKRKARPRRTAERRQESTTSVAAGCTCITCRTDGPCLRAFSANRSYGDPRSPVKKEKPSAHLRQNPVWNTVRTNAPRVAAWNSRICKSHELF